MFEIKSCDNLSLTKLTELNKRGDSVIRSAHAGNLYPANLAVAAAGIPVLFYDRVLGRKDQASHPNRVIKNGIAERVCSDLVLVSRAHVDTQPSAEPERFARGHRVATSHRQALHDLLPEQSVPLWTDYLHKRVDFVMEILAAISQKHPEIWYRSINEDGIVVNKLRVGHSPEGGWKAVENDLYGITNPSRGWLMNNAMNVLVNALIEAYETGHNVVYHTGGVDMGGYLPQLLPAIQEYFDAAKGVRGVPQSLTFRFATIASMRFAGPLCAQRAVDDLFESGQELIRLEAEASRRLRIATGVEKKEIIGEIVGRRGKLRDRVRESATQSPCMYKVSDGDFFSQYDALARGLYVNEEALATPLTELADICAMLERHVRYA